MPGQRGCGYLIRSPDDEELFLALFAFEGDCNPLRLMRDVASLYAISADELRRLIDLVQVTEGGYFALPLKRPSELSKSEIADHIMRLDPRLCWREERWKFD